jgi:malonyl-CoA O-methyltransferase
VYCPQNLASALEIGCGSGNLTHLFHSYFQVDQLFLNDLYEDVDQHFSTIENIAWLIGDIEQLHLPQSLDAVISSSALQWMTDLPALLQRIHDALKPKGYLGFSTFGENNLIEIKKLTGQGLNYYSIDVLKQKLEENGFEIVFIQEEQKNLYFDDPKLVLHHLKATGVTATAKSHRWTKQSLQQFYLDYQQFYGEQGFSLTYHPIYVIARRIA